MADQALSREQQMLAFFVDHCDGRIGRTQLIKFLYLADLEARRFLGHPISALQYKWYRYGPYDDRFRPALDGLVATGVIREEPVEYPSGRSGFLYVSGKGPIAFDFAPAERDVLYYICETYSRVSLQSLLDDIVYETEPMKKAKEDDAFDKPLDMALVNNTRRFDLGVPYDTLMSRRASARAGDVAEHRDVMDRLRSRRPDAGA